MADSVSSGSLSGVLKNVSDFVTASATAYAGVQNAQFALDQRRLALQVQKAQLDAARLAVRTNASISVIQAQDQLTRAQNAAAVPVDGTTFMDNLSSQVAKIGGSNRLMLIIAVAGLGLAWMQYRKR